MALSFTAGTFVPDTDANYALYKTAVGQASASDYASYTEVAPMSGQLKPIFDDYLILYFCNLADASAGAGTALVTSTTMTAAIAAARNAALSGEYPELYSTFPVSKDASTTYQAYLKYVNQQSASDASSYTEVTPMNGNLFELFKTALIQVISLECTAGATVSSADWSGAGQMLAQALQSAVSGNRTF
jgi:hypothetical protein